MNISFSRQTFWLFGSFVVCTISTHLLSAQDVVPPSPPLPDRALMNQAESEIPVPVMQSDIEAEVLTRGPVHEAFAEQYVTDPKPTPIIEIAPPELIDELPPEDLPEGANVEWIPGYWAFDEDVKDFIWISGLWRDLPPGQQWVPGYWGEVDRGWQWVPGFWSSAEQDELTYLPEPPESLEQGPNIEAPSPEYFWTPGTWVYQTNRYSWQPGCWARPYNDYLWVPSRYQWTPRGYVHCSGYWDYPVYRRGVLFSPVHFHNRHHRHRYHGYRYRPSVAVSAGPLLVHLFVRPHTRHYYFGDYYAHHYRSRGIFHLTRYNSHSRHRHAYDPIRSYYQTASRRTTYNRLVDWHHYFDRHESHRPAHTQRQAYDRSRRNGSRNSVVTQQATLSQPLTEMIAKTRTSSKSKYGIQSFRHIQERDRDQLSSRSKSAVQNLKAQRIAFETRRRGPSADDRNKPAESRLGKVDANRLRETRSGKEQLKPKTGAGVASLKLPENSVLRGRLDDHRDRLESQSRDRNNLAGARNNAQRTSGDIKKRTENQTAQTRDAGSRSQLESLRERIEATRKLRPDEKSVTRRDGRDPSDAKDKPVITNRNAAAASGNDVRSKIEAARKSTEKTARTTKPSSDLKKRIEAADRFAESRRKTTNATGSKSSRSTAAEQDDLRKRVGVTNRISPRSTTPRSELSVKPSIQPATKTPNSPRIDRGTRSSSSADLNSRIEAARRASSSRKQSATGTVPKTSPSTSARQTDMRARIEAARKASAARRDSRSGDSSTRSSSNRSTTPVPKASTSRSRIPTKQPAQAKQTPSRSPQPSKSVNRSSSSRSAAQDAINRARSSSSSRSAPSRSPSSRSSSPKSRPPSSSSRSSTPSKSSSSSRSSSPKSSASSSRKSSSSSSRSSRSSSSSRSRSKKK